MERRLGIFNALREKWATSRVKSTPEPQRKKVLGLKPPFSDKQLGLEPLTDEQLGLTPEAQALPGESSFDYQLRRLRSKREDPTERRIGDW
jgi:hypothetical protein